MAKFVLESNWILTVTLRNSVELMIFILMQ